MLIPLWTSILRHFQGCVTVLACLDHLVVMVSCSAAWCLKFCVPWANRDSYPKQFSSWVKRKNPPLPNWPSEGHIIVSFLPGHLEWICRQGSRVYFALTPHLSAGCHRLSLKALKSPTLLENSLIGVISVISVHIGHSNFHGLNFIWVRGCQLPGARAENHNCEQPELPERGRGSLSTP